MKTSFLLTLIIKLSLTVFAVLVPMPAYADFNNQLSSHTHEKPVNRADSKKSAHFYQKYPTSSTEWFFVDKKSGNEVFNLNSTVSSFQKSPDNSDNKQANELANILTASDFSNSLVKPKSDQPTNESAITTVPLPATAVFFGTAVTGIIGYSRRRNGYRLILPAKDIPIMGLNLAIENENQTLVLFQEWINTKTPHQVFFANVHNVISCLKDPDLMNISQNSHNAMDGLPLVWYTKLVHKAYNASRVSGPDIMLKCLDKGRDRNWKHFFLGGTDLALNNLAASMENRFPGVNIVGSYSPPFRILTDQEDDELVALINAAQPDFLWVGLGAPKQEKWIATHLDRVNAPVQLGVGAAFNFHSGQVKRAPYWMQKTGFEWLYRMLKEKRLIKRYLTTNPVFLLLFIRDLFLTRVLRIKPM